MACPGGCVGGGGQSMPTTRSIVKKRAATLYTIDDKAEIKRAHENQDVKKVYDTYLTNQEIRHKILHTHFFARKRSQISELENSKKTVDLQL
jgi:iron only hydrogenase large subunit-like protein